MFKLGDIVVFEPKNLNPNFWNKLSERERIFHYDDFGYRGENFQIDKFFIFITPINYPDGDNSKAIILDMGLQRFISVTISMFRKATESEV